MSDTIYKLHAVVSASTDAAASVDIQDDGHIEGMLLTLSCQDADALNDGGRLEVSFSSTSAFSANDTRASIGGIDIVQNFLTTGGGAMANQVFCAFSKGIPVAAGERIFLHVFESGAVTQLKATAWLYVVTTGARRRASARRR